LFGLDPFTIVAATIVGILSVGRTARLIGFDDYPPIVWLRVKWYDRFSDQGWGKLIYCPFCSAPYLAAGMLAWAWVSGLHWSWWVINGWWGLSYLSSILVAYDQPEE
jgi:hypothetical protein